MDLLRTIDDMPGPQFLVLYGVVILVTLVMCRFWPGRRDRTKTLPTPPVPKDFDPIGTRLASVSMDQTVRAWLTRPVSDPAEIAYLRGKENEVTRLTVFGLLQRGYLEMIETRKGLFTRQQIQQSADHPDLHELTPMERDVFDYFTSPFSASGLFPSLPRIIAEHCREYRQHGEENNLLTTSEARRAALTARLAGAFIVVGLGVYRLWDALDEGRTNVGYLVIMGIIGLMLVEVVCCKGRLTSLGRRYLVELHVAFDRNRTGSESDRRPIIPTSHPEYQSDSALFIAMGVLGVSALDGTGYAYFGNMFKKGSGGWFAGWLGGCGGGGGGCGGGGGGGGCGGGGCGGG